LDPLRGSEAKTEREMKSEKQSEGEKSKAATSLLVAGPLGDTLTTVARLTRELTQYRSKNSKPLLSPLFIFPVEKSLAYWIRCFVLELICYLAQASSA
jgi:hypothetical protein